MVHRIENSAHDLYGSISLGGSAGSDGSGACAGSASVGDYWGVGSGQISGSSWGKQEACAAAATSAAMLANSPNPASRALGYAAIGSTAYICTSSELK